MGIKRDSTGLQQGALQRADPEEAPAEACCYWYHWGVPRTWKLTSPGDTVGDICSPSAAAVRLARQAQKLAASECRGGAGLLPSCWLHFCLKYNPALEGLPGAACAHSWGTPQQGQSPFWVSKEPCEGHRAHTVCQKSHQGSGFLSLPGGLPFSVSQSSAAGAPCLCCPTKI